MGSYRRPKIVNMKKRLMEAGGIMIILTSISGEVKLFFCGDVYFKWSNFSDVV